MTFPTVNQSRIAPLASEFETFAAEAQEADKTVSLSPLSRRDVDECPCDAANVESQGKFTSDDRATTAPQESRRLGESTPTCACTKEASHSQFKPVHGITGPPLAAMAKRNELPMVEELYEMAKDGASRLAQICYGRCGNTFPICYPRCTGVYPVSLSPGRFPPKNP